MTPENALSLLKDAKIFFTDNPTTDEDNPEGCYEINFNDTWAWACSDGEYVPHEDIPELAELFRDYGWCGVLYWSARRNSGAEFKIGDRHSEFADVNRFIDFVAQEEKLREEIPSDNKRAFHKLTYTLGELNKESYISQVMQRGLLSE